jgi:hypothetical protein
MIKEFFRVLFTFLVLASVLVAYGLSFAFLVMHFSPMVAITAQVSLAVVWLIFGMLNWTNNTTLGRR